MRSDISIDVLGLGCLAVDEILLSPIWPEPDTKTRLLARDRQGGGLTGNAMVAAARFGAKVSYGGSLGVDDDSRFLRDLYLKEGINLTHCRTDPQFRPIRSTIVIDQSQNTRTIWFDLPGHLGAREDWPPAELITQSKVLFVDHYGMEGMIRAAKIARASGVEVVADFERDEHPRFEEILPLVDHLILSSKFATKRTGLQNPRDAVEALAKIGAKVTIVTNGELGAWVVGKGIVFPFRPTRLPLWTAPAVEMLFMGFMRHALRKGWGFLIA
ncbi:MAG: PfkB family carbohydrate kinase [Planctomycetota bacterium]|nr:PfkB family carbohydrate kinase [Planctomycetota bacterium]